MAAPGAWQACVVEPAFTDGEDIWIGSTSAANAQRPQSSGSTSGCRSAARSTTVTPACSMPSTNPRANIDSVIALAMAVERAEHKPEPVELLGWRDAGRV